MQPMAWLLQAKYYQEKLRSVQTQPIGCCRQSGTKRSWKCTNSTHWSLQAKYYQEKLGVHKHSPLVAAGKVLPREARSAQTQPGRPSGSGAFLHRRPALGAGVLLQRGGLLDLVLPLPLCPHDLRHEGHRGIPCGLPAGQALPALSAAAGSAAQCIAQAAAGALSGKWAFLHCMGCLRNQDAVHNSMSYFLPWFHLHVGRHMSGCQSLIRQVHLWVSLTEPFPQQLCVAPW